MSAPETNIEKQKKRHWPSLYGIGFAAAAAVAIAILVTAWPTAPLDEDGAVPAAATD